MIHSEKLKTSDTTYLCTECVIIGIIKHLKTGQFMHIAVVVKSQGRTQYAVDIT